MRPGRRTVRALWSAVIFLALIGMAAVIRRAIVLMPVLASGHSTVASDAFDAGFAGHPLLTMVHIVPGFLFMVLGPLQFVRRIRARKLWLHRWSGRVFIAIGIVIGISALAMSFQTSIGGANET